MLIFKEFQCIINEHIFTLAINVSSLASETSPAMLIYIFKTEIERVYFSEWVQFDYR